MPGTAERPRLDPSRLRLHAIVAGVETARAAVAGGATAVQLRLKGATTAERVRLGLRLRELPVLLVVDDDVDAALQVGADAVHLGETDPGAERALAAGLPLGRSASTVAAALEAEREGAAYLGTGPVWATPTKPDAGDPLGLDGLRRVCAAVSLPVVAIGGVDPGNARACLEAGAMGVAVVRAARDAAALRAAIDAAAPSPGGATGRA